MPNDRLNPSTYLLPDEQWDDAKAKAFDDEVREGIRSAFRQVRCNGFIRYCLFKIGVRV